MEARGRRNGGPAPWVGGERLCSGPGAAHKGRPRSPACGAGAAPAVLRQRAAAGRVDRNREEPSGAKRPPPPS